MTLADGVLKAMFLKKLTIAAGLTASLGLGVVGILAVHSSRAQDSPKSGPPRAQSRDTTHTLFQTPPETEPLLAELIAAARLRFEAQRAFYEEGRITLDRYIAASSALERVSLLAAKDVSERKAIRQRRVDVAKQVEGREKSELDAGRGTLANLLEARQARMQAEFDMKSGDKEDTENASLLRRLGRLERKVERLEKERGAAPIAR